MNKFLIGVAGLSTLIAPMAASAQGYAHERGDYGRGGYDRGGYDRGDYNRGGAAIAAGVAGLVIGSALASSGDRYDNDYRPAYGYAQPYPYEAYGYAPRCYVQSRPYYTPYGDVAYRQVRVCR